MPLRRGRVALHRGFLHDRLAWVTVNRMVSDDERGLLLWRGTGGPHVTRATVDGRGIRDVPFPEWMELPTVLHHGVWRHLTVLTLIPPDAGHSIWWLFRDGEFMSWYVNLEEPTARWEDGETCGLDFTDQDLDIVVAPDRSWHWKDEEEFAERLAHPEHYWVRDAAAVRAEGERLIPLIEAGKFPFDGTWCDFTPEWPTPTELPPGWDRPRVSR